MIEQHEKIEKLARDILMSTVGRDEQFHSLRSAEPSECFDLATEFYDESNKRLRQLTGNQND